MANSYQELDAWRKSMALVEHCYARTERLPKAELYGLVGQIRRAAVSIPSNVAEGHCRRSTRAYANHVSIALGSQAELETCIELARRLRLLPDDVANTLLVEAATAGQILTGLHRALKARLRDAPSHG